jgi:hypothetical protein
MYTIIGGDGKQYGPISETDLRKWIAEGRLNAQSLAKAESDAEFRTLSTFPEFASLLGIAPPTLGAAPVLGANLEDRELARQKVKVPAIGLMITAIVSILFIILELFFRSMLLQMIANNFEQVSNDPQTAQLMQQMTHTTRGPIGIACNIFQLIISILILVGATRMIKLRSYQFSYAAAILSVIPCITISCCAWPLGLIFGIWSLVVLGKMKPHFS